MNLKRLQAFQAVLELGSVTAAAKRLGTTQPAVSRLISDLEHELGLALFERRRQKLLPTEEGRSFFRETERALAAVDRIAEVAREIRTSKVAHLRVVCAMTAGFGLMPAVTRTLLGSHPTLKVSIAIKDIRELADWVTSGPFDVGITRMPFHDARIECEQLVSGNCVLVVPIKHHLARKRVVSLRDLDGEQMIQPLPGNMHRDLVATAFATAGIPYTGRVEATTALSACQLAAEGLGLTIVDPYSFRAAAGLSLVARPLRPALQFSMGLFFPANRPRSKIIQAFIKAARSTIASLGPA
jgi:DNA-binding transcriptional LysR family regulator